MQSSGKPSAGQPTQISQSANADLATGSHVNVPLRQVFPWLAAAAAQNAAWLDDFGDDIIRLPIDLMDVIEAYQHFNE